MIFVQVCTLKGEKHFHFDCCLYNNIIEILLRNLSPLPHPAIFLQDGISYDQDSSFFIKLYMKLRTKKEAIFEENVESSSHY